MNRNLLLKPYSAIVLSALVLLIAGCTSRSMVPANMEAAGSNDAQYLQPRWTVTQIASGFSSGLGQLAVDADGDVYVVLNSPSNSVMEIAPDGTITEIGHGFSSPDGVAVYNGYVYVADYAHNEIKKVAKDGAISVVERLKNPGSITVSKGAIYAVDDVCKSVYVCINKIASNGTTTLVTTDLNVDNLTLDTAGNLYAAAYSFGRYGCCATGKIYKITPNGNISMRSFKGLAPESVAVDAMGNIYVGATRSRFQKPALYKITPSGVVTAIAHFVQSDSIFDGLAFRNGALYAGITEVNDYANSAVYKITP